MIKHLRYIRQIIIINFSYFLAYRLNLINEFLSSTIWGSFSFVSIILLTTKATSVYGWSREELYILTGSFGIIYGLFAVFMIRNMNRFEVVMDRGLLDYHLLKPIDAQFTLSSWVINYAASVRIFIGLAIVSVYSSRMHLVIDAWTIIGYICLLLFGIIIMYCVWFTAAIVLIWNPRLSNVIEVMYTVSNIAKYPPEMFNAIKNVLFFMIPITLMIATPTKVLLHKILLGDIFWLVFSALLIFYLTRRLWIYSLRHYTSAN